MLKLMVIIAGFLSFFGCNSSSSTIKEGDSLVYFSLHRGGGMARFGGYRYNIEATKDGKVHFLFNEGYPDEKEYYLEDHSVFDSLDLLIRKYKMEKYRSNYMPKFDVLDGESWSIYVKYASGASISSGGYMAGPDNWREAEKALIQCLQPWKDMPGVVNEVNRFKYSYGTTTYLIERKEDHALLTVDDPSEGRHEVHRKGLDMLENLRVMINVEGLKENGSLKSDDPESTPFVFEIDYSNGDSYFYESYDLKYQCHYTEVLQWFFSEWLSNNE